MSKVALKERKTATKRQPATKAAVMVEEAPAPVEAVPVEAAAAAEVIGPVCVHRWVIESPNGETSHGVCRYCGAEKEFPNAAEDGLWERNVPQSRWTGRSDWKPSESGY